MGVYSKRRVGTVLECAEGEGLLSNAIQGVIDLDRSFFQSSDVSMNCDHEFNDVLYHHTAPSLSINDMFMENIFDPLLNYMPYRMLARNDVIRSLLMLQRLLSRTSQSFGFNNTRWDVTCVSDAVFQPLYR